MAKRRVTHTTKGREGIVSVCNPGSAWSPRSAHDATEDITSGRHIYYVEGEDGRIEIRVVVEFSRPTLRTDPEKTERNMLEELPDCRRTSSQGAHRLLDPGPPSAR